MNTIHPEFLPIKTDKEQLLGTLASKTEVPIIPATDLPDSSESSIPAPHYPEFAQYARGNHTDGFM